MEGMNTEDIGELIHELLDHVEDLTAHIERIETENAALAEALGVHQGDEDEAGEKTSRCSRNAAQGPARTSTAPWTSARSISSRSLRKTVEPAWTRKRRTSKRSRLSADRSTPK